MATRGLSLLIFFSLVSSALIGGVSATGSSGIILERGMCYGYCPVYSLYLWENGSVLYNGTLFVKEIGQRDGTINETAFLQILQMAKDSGFFAMNDTYDRVDVTDMPSAIITINSSSLNKRVEHYHGDLSAPQALSTLEEAIDTAAGVSRWTEPSQPGDGSGEMI